MPKADATGLAPEKSAQPDPPALSMVREGSLRCDAPISWVKSRSGGLGYLNALIARRAFQMPLRSGCAKQESAAVKLRNSTGNSLRTSGGKSVTRYTVVGIDLRQVQLIDHIGDEPRQVSFRKPVLERRWE